jgi:hypothetical protein
MLTVANVDSDRNQTENVVFRDSSTNFVIDLISRRETWRSTWCFQNTNLSKGTYSKSEELGQSV